MSNFQNDLDKFGYYTSQGRKTYSKFEAMEYSSRYRWHFNDEVFASYNWLTEPASDVNYFYDQRATQIRDKYDYIVLFYSGGFDSHNILKTFVDNGLHLDEVLSNIPSLDIASTQTLEYKVFTSKKIEKYKQLLPNTVFRLVEYRDMLLGELINQRDILYNLNHRYTANHLVKNIYKRMIPAHRSLVEAGKKICYLFGVDKPMIVNHDGEYFSRFSELAVCNYVLPKLQFDRNDEIKYEFFYWSPDCVPLLIKQAHLAKKYYKDRLGSANKHYRDRLSNLDYEAYDFDQQRYNYHIYPRCRDDSTLGYFYEPAYHNMYQQINAKRAVGEIHGVGGRDSWIHDLNHEVVAKTYGPILFIQERFKKEFVLGDPMKHLKINHTYYSLGR